MRFASDLQQHLPLTERGNESTVGVNSTASTSLATLEEESSAVIEEINQPEVIDAKDEARTFRP